SCVCWHDPVPKTLRNGSPQGETAADQKSGFCDYSPPGPYNGHRFSTREASGSTGLWEEFPSRCGAVYMVDAGKLSSGCGNSDRAVPEQLGFPQNHRLLLVVIDSATYRRTSIGQSHLWRRRTI